MAADGDIACTVLTRYTGKVLAAVCNQAMCSGEDRVWSEFYDWVTGGDYCLYETNLWNYDRTCIRALDEGRTREESDVKRVLVKFSDAHELEHRVEQVD